MVLDLKRIEKTSILLAFICILILALTGIIAIADGLYKWDILSDQLEQFAILAMLFLGIVLLACIILSILISLSRIANNLARIADKTENLNHNRNENG